MERLICLVIGYLWKRRLYQRPAGSGVESRAYDFCRGCTKMCDSNLARALSIQRKRVPSTFGNVCRGWSNVGAQFSFLFKI